MILKTSYKMKPPVSARIYRGSSIGRCNVSNYSLNEKSGLVAFDSGVNKNNLTFNGNVAWSRKGKFGPALDFNTNGFLRKTSANNMPNEKGSAVMWLNVANTSNTDVFFHLTDGTNQNQIVLYKSANFLFLSIASGGVGTDVWRSAGNILTGGIWAHLAVTWDTDIDSYIVYFDTAVITPAISNVSAAPVSITQLDIGAFRGGGYYYDGLIDNFSFYNRVLTHSEIIKHFLSSFYIFDRPMDPLFSIAGAPPEIQALFMDLSTQIWTIKHSTGLFTKL